MILIDGIIFSLQRTGGISVYFNELIAYLTRQQIKTEISLFGQNYLTIAPIVDSLSITHKPTRLGERYRKSPKSGLMPQIYHSSYYRDSAWGHKVQRVVTVHDFVYERYMSGPRRWVHSWQKNIAIRSADAIICVSEATRQDLLQLVGVRENQLLEVIHCGVSEKFHQINVPLSATPFLLYVGQRSGYKNFRLAAQALEFLPDLALFCVGGGQLKNNELTYLPHRIRDRIKHLGFVNDDELNMLYNQAKCLIYPSSYEGFGIPVIEAMRAGCPVVSTNCKAIIEVGGKALTVAVEADPRALADAVIQIMSPEYRNYVVSAGLEISKGYSWNNTHEKTLKVYRNLGMDFISK